MRPPAWKALLAAMGCLVSSPLYGHGAYHDVVDEIETELRLAPNDAALRFKLAEAHAGHDEWRACLAELKLIERLAPGRFPTVYLRGLSLHIAGNDEAARKVLDEFITGNPDHGDALATRGRVLMRLGLPSEAAKDFQRAFDKAVTPNTDLILDLAKAYDKSGEPEKASGVIDKGLKTSGDSPSLLQYALAIESARGDWDAALGRIDSLQNTAAGNPESWMGERAQTLAKAGRSHEASAAWSTLRDRLLALPTLERGYPQNRDLLKRARQALGEPSLPVVAAPPAPAR